MEKSLVKETKIRQNFVELKNGDIINLSKMILIRLSRSEECAYMYLEGLYHSSGEFPPNSTKMVEITLEDYDKIRKMLV